MKSIKLLLLGLCILTSYYLSGQSNKIEIGIEGSPSIISLRGNEFLKENQKVAISFTGGLFFQYNLNKIFSLRTNIAFERKGTYTSVYATDEYGNTDFIKTRSNFDYIIVPILLRGNYGHKIKYYANIGPYFGYLLKELSVIELPTKKIAKQDETNSFNRYDSGITFGLGVLYPIKQKISISFEIRNNLGLYNILRQDYIFPGNQNLKTNSINLLFSISYNIGENLIEKNTEIETK